MAGVQNCEVASHVRTGFIMFIFRLTSFASDSDFAFLRPDVNSLWRLNSQDSISLRI